MNFYKDKLADEIYPELHRKAGPTEQCMKMKVNLRTGTIHNVNIAHLPSSAKSNCFIVILTY